MLPITSSVGVYHTPAVMPALTPLSALPDEPLYIFLSSILPLSRAQGHEVVVALILIARHQHGVLAAGRLDPGLDGE